MEGPALVASGKASPHASYQGPLGIPLPSMPVPKTLCGVGARTQRCGASVIIPPWQSGVITPWQSGDIPPWQSGVIIPPWQPGGV